MRLKEGCERRIVELENRKNQRIKSGEGTERRVGEEK